VYGGMWGTCTGYDHALEQNGMRNAGWMRADMPVKDI
jgi:hypothetical protein